MILTCRRLSEHMIHIKDESDNKDAICITITLDQFKRFLLPNGKRPEDIPLHEDFKFKLTGGIK